jgi:hypothetical protein
MKLDLNSLFKLFEEIEKSGILTEFESPTSSPIQKGGEEVKTIKVPRLFISEEWGEQTSSDRGDLDRAITLATGGKKSTDPFETLTNLEEGLKELEQKIVNKVSADSPGRVLGQLVVIDTINRLFNSFQSSPLGFVNEAFVSALYGGKQVKLNRQETGDGSEAESLSSQIGDVITSDGIPVSVKTLVPNGIVKGSWKNLVDSFNNQPPGKQKIYFDVFSKQTSEEDKKVLGFTAYRFEINTDNIEQLSDGRVTSRVETKDGKEKRVFILDGKPITEDLEDKIDYSLDNLGNVLEELRKNKWEPEKNVAQYLTAFILSTEKYKEIMGVDSAEGYKRRRGEALVKYALDKGLIGEDEVKAFAGSIQKATGEREREEQMGKNVKLQGRDTQFSLPANAWKALVTQQGGKAASLNFSKERINNLIRESLTLLGESIVNLFNEVDNFSKLVDEYLGSMAPNRGDIGKAAVDAAERIKPSTEEIVK